jgi:hypothetical protein
MTDIVVTAAQVSRVKSYTDEVMDFTVGTAVTAGMPVYVVTSTGKVAPADGSAASTAQVRGIALQSKAAGETVAVLKRGKVEGFTLEGDYDSRVYLSDTTGTLGDSAGTVSVIVGRVVLARGTAGTTKLLYVDTNWLTQYS